MTSTGDGLDDDCNSATDDDVDDDDDSTTGDDLNDDGDGATGDNNDGQCATASLISLLPNTQIFKYSDKETQPHSLNVNS